MFSVSNHKSKKNMVIVKAFTMKPSSCSASLMIYSRPCWWDQISFISYLCKLCRTAHVSSEGLRWTEKGGINRSAFIWSFNLSHLVFSSSCLGEADRTSVKMNLKEPSLLASFETRSGAKCLGKRTHQKNFNVGFQKKKVSSKRGWLRR